jgi:DNA-binding transcriptional MerR regulator
MKRLVSSGVAARDLGVSIATLSRWTARGYITPAQTTAGGQYRWDLASLHRQVERIRRPGGIRQLDATDIAQVIYAANREVQIITGDPRPSPDWYDAPEYQRRETIASVNEAISDPARTAEQNHQGWYDRLVAEGWTHGEVKDAEAKTHPDLLPFDQLPKEEQLKDRLFIAIVRALAPGNTAPQ